MVKVSSLILSDIIKDDTRINISVQRLHGEYRLVTGKRWYEDSILEWSDADVYALEYDGVNNELTILV